MTIANWLSPELMRPAAWALLHFLWQGTALAALAAVVMACFRRASARYIAAVSVLVAMLAAPVATFFYYRDASPAAAGTMVTPAPAVMHLADGKAAPSASFVPQRRASDLFPWIVQAWLIGVAFFSLRSAGGFLVLERMRRRQSLPVSGRLRDLCLDLQVRLGVTRAIRYCQCAWLEAPAVIGWLRPVVFLPLTALTGLSERQLQAVIAHELAHIKRLDSLVNGFQVVVETLLFYHPAVWWMNQRIRTERENCCDDTAIALCGSAVEYARALTLMEEWRVAPALAMAANRGPLSARITRLLGIRDFRAGLRGIGLTAGVLSLSVALVAVNAIFGLTEKVSAQASPAPSATPAPAANPRPVAKSSPAAKPSPSRPADSAEAPVSAGSYIEGMKAAGLGDVSVDDLIALKIQGVTPEYVREMKKLGIHPDADTLVGMKVQGVTPEYISDLRAAGVKVGDNEIIGMKVQGIDAVYVRAMQQEGIHADADELIGMKVQGVTPEYVRDIKAQGFQPSADGIIGMKVQHVTPEYIRDVRALGLKPTADDIIGMKVQGVTPDYIKALQSAGFKFDTDELISAKVQGITPEFIEKAKKRGFQNLTLDKLIQLKHLGVLDNEGEI
jgi:beta-lactamase regulating signal transducer with metallopeptidase domain